MTAHAIASKFRRALRNGTGANFSHDQFRQLGEYGILKVLSEIEADELCPAQTAHTSLAITGSTSGGTGTPHPDILAEIERLTSMTRAGEGL